MVFFYVIEELEEPFEFEFNYDSIDFFILAKGEKMNIVAIDVSKAKLDAYFDSSKSHQSFRNDLAGIQELIKSSPKVAVFVFEATGGYENDLLLTLVEKKRTIFRCCGKRVREFANSQGKAKTDKLDAEMIAKYAKASNLIPFSLAQKELLELRELNIRRSQAMSMMRQEANRLEHKLPKAIEKLIKKNIRSYEKETALLDEMILDCIETNPELLKKVNLVRSIPGAGLQTAVTILSELPELGSLDRSEAGSMSGLSPRNKDSGTQIGKRRISYSRQRVKGVLYMSAMTAIRVNPKIKAFYQKLRKKGKPGKVALTACMRKMIVIINSMLASETHWNLS